MDKKIAIRCNGCTKEFEIPVYQTINAQFDQELKRQIIRGDLFANTCPNCGTVNYSLYNVLYNDMENQVMIRFTTGNVQEEINNFAYSEEFVEELGILKQALKGYQYRFIDDPFKFAEVVDIFDAGYDDRVIQLYKVLVAHDYYHDNNERSTSIDFDYNDGTGKYVFLVMKDDELLAMSDFDSSIYNGLEKNYRPYFEKANE